MTQKAGRYAMFLRHETHIGLYNDATKPTFTLAIHNIHNYYNKM